MTITRSQLTKTTERKMPAGKGTYGTKKGRPPKKKKNGKSKRFERLDSLFNQ